MNPGQVNALVHYENERNRKLEEEQQSVVGSGPRRGGAGVGRRGGSVQPGPPGMPGAQDMFRPIPMGSRSGNPMPEAAGSLKDLIFPVSPGKTQF